MSGDCQDFRVQGSLVVETWMMVRTLKAWSCKAILVEDRKLPELTSASHPPQAPPKIRPTAQTFRASPHPFPRWRCRALPSTDRARASPAASASFSSKVTAVIAPSSLSSLVQTRRAFGTLRDTCRRTPWALVPWGERVGRESARERFDMRSFRPCDRST